MNRQVKAQESAVHKLAKSIAKEIKYIKVPAINTRIFGQEYTIAEEQIIKVRFVECEKRDASTCRIPDIILEMEYMGIKQKLYLEIFYKHPVGMNKKQQFRDNRINCVEADISELRLDVNLSESALRKKIKDTIENKCYWVSNAYKEIFDVTVNKHIADINSSNILNNSFMSNPSEEERFFIFRDDHVMMCGKPCRQGDRLKSINIGDCMKCERCLYIKEAESENINDINIYCLKSEPDTNNVNLIELLNNIINESMQTLRESEE